MYVCICMYVRMHVGMYVQGGPKVGIQYIVCSIITVYLLLAHPVCMYACMHVCVYVCMCMYVCMHACM
jgi:hypothetical protein